ncbi:MAG: hypothetical protein COA71_13810 [SAR86 cluster bacterium]|uniref:TonB-dependent hemoglobin/transferrin/lactoferrin family receptor n=1 Tax=SAR86 cluster bacterium TaxID=2030880 RepID=A0A2A5C7S5_9GAMM|nr:MAG: hypothetical protein COA71_13810 [SAR86 cluster bacterium]
MFVSTKRRLNKKKSLRLIIPFIISSGLFGIESFAAAQSTTEAEEILVTATRLDRSEEDIAGTVTVISNIEMQQTLVEDLDDLVRYQPGISMSTSARGGNQGFVIRGIGGNRILTLMDGVRSSDFYAAGPASYGKDNFETEDLQTVEIIRGPASVLYGADAMGGAVIMRSKGIADYLSADRNSFLGLRTSYNSANNMGKLGFTGVRQFTDIGAMLQFTHRDFEESDVEGPGQLNPQDGENNSLLAKFEWNQNVDRLYNLTLNYYEEEIDTVLLNEISASVNASAGLDETERFRVSAGLEWNLDTSLADHFEAQVYWQDTDALQNTRQERISYSFINPTNPMTYGGSLANRVTDFTFKQETSGLELSFNKQLTAGSIQHTLVYGTAFEVTATERPRNRCETEISSGSSTCAIAAYPFAVTEDFPNKTFPDTDATRFGLYLQDEVILGNSGFTLIPGLRFDRYEMDADTQGLQDVINLGYRVSDYESDEVSFNLGLIYDISSNTSVFAQYAEGFRPPNFSEANQSFVNLGFGYATVPNPDLEAETSQNLEFGIRSSFENSNINLTFYRNDYDKFIETQSVGFQGGLSLFQQQNIDKVEIYGAELQGSHRLNERLVLQGSLAYSKGDNKINNTPLNSVAPLTGVLGLRYEPVDQTWGIEGLVTVVADKDRVANAGDVVADSYEVLDIIANYAFSETAQIRLGVFNVLGTEYARWSNIQGLSAASITSIQRAQEAGATLRMSLSLNF